MKMLLKLVHRLETFQFKKNSEEKLEAVANYVIVIA